MAYGREYGLRRDTYWASIAYDGEDDAGGAEDFVSEVMARREKYIETVKSSNFIARAMRNWRYYHNLFFSGGGQTSTDVVALGEQGEIAGLSVNHLRNLLQHLLTMTTQNRPAWDARAVNSERKSLAQARRANALLEYYMRDKRVERYLKQAVEHALVFGMGYVMVTWNPNVGEPIATDEDGNIFYEGDIKVDTPTIFDVIFDPAIQNWDENQWVLVREYVNRWDLVSRFPHMREEILAFEEDPNDDFEVFLGSDSTTRLTDRISAWHFMHAKTEAMPEGRYALILDDELLLSTALPYQGIPLARVAASDMLLTAFGYSPGFDLQGLQEALNNEMSVILSNHKSHGLQHVWSPPGNNVTAKTLDGGLNLVTSDVKPEPLNLVHTPPEIFNFVNILLQHLEYISGINSVARGQPEASLKSGTALALIDAKAVQFASSLVHSYHMLLEDVGSHIVKILGSFSQSERLVSIIGKHGRSTHEAFTGDDLQLVKRVYVDSANPLSKTLAGRIDLAEKLRPWMQNQEEYLNVIETGSIDPLVESDRSQLDLIRAENEALMEGVGVPGALKTDNHVLHVREHSAQLNSPEIRADQMATQNVLAHIMEHLQQLMEPSTIQVQAMLGYQIPPAPPTGDISPGAPGPRPGGPGPDLGGRPPANGNAFAPPGPGEPKVRPPQPPKPPRVPRPQGAA